MSGGQEVLQKTRPPLLGDVDLVLQVSPVRCLGVLDFPGERLDLRFQLGLLVFKLKVNLKNS